MYSAVQPFVQPVAISVLAYLRLFLNCTHYHSILLLHDHQSTQLASSILQEMQVLSPVVWLPTNMESFNICSSYSTASNRLYHSPNSLILNLIDGPLVGKKFEMFRKALAVNEKCDNLIVTPGDISQMEMTSVLQVVLKYQVLNVGVVFVPDGMDVSLIKLHYRSFSSRAIDISSAACSHIKSQLFYDIAQDLRNTEIIIHLYFEVPRVINLTQTSNEYNPYPYEVGGRDAYFSTLIDYRFGTKSTNLAFKLSPEFIQQNHDLSIFLREFVEKPYREDRLKPGELDYELMTIEEFEKSV